MRGDRRLGPAGLRRSRRGSPTLDDAARPLSRDRGEARRSAVRHRRRRLQGRPARLAAAARPGRQGAALGARAQIPGRAGRDDLEAIDIQVGRTGKLTPVARLEPVTRRRRHRHQRDAAQCATRSRGSACASATGCVIQRAGDVIPQVRRESDAATRTARPSSSPTIAPNAAREAVREEGEVDVRCTGGLICPAQRVERLRHFVSRARARHRGARRSPIIASFFDDGCCSRPPTSSACTTTRRAGRPRGLGRNRSTNLIAAIEAKRAPAARPLAVRARHPPCRRGDRARPAEGASATLAAAARGRAEAAARRATRSARAPS